MQREHYAAANGERQPTNQPNQPLHTPHCVYIVIILDETRTLRTKSKFA